MRIAFIGIGQVGSGLADHLATAGHDIVIAARDTQSGSVLAAQKKNAALKALPTSEALTEADVVFLATPYQANAAALKGLETLLADKVLVDCTNPVGPNLTHGLESKISGSEEVQKLVPAAKVVKAFTIYGFENFDNSAYPGYGALKPAMLIAGNDAGAKKTVGQLCVDLGWTPVDSGPLANSLHLEHMTLLWIKMGRVQGKGAGFVWAMLER